MSQRHRARRLALQGLCCLDAQGPGVMDLIGQFLDDSREPAETVELSRTMLTQAFAAREDCDAVLSRHTRDWNLARLAMVDRNILRLAVWELVIGRTPPKVVIVEAIRLAREFSAAESPRFINGVLDAVARELAGGQADQPASTPPEPPPADQDEQM